MKRRLLYNLSTTDKVYEYLQSIFIEFNGPRNTLSTSPLNGGYREDLKYVFNQDGKDKSTGIYTLKAPNYIDHLRIVSSELGLNPTYTSGISTAASMENLSFVEKEYRGLKVTALTTGSTERNGGRVGDPSFFDERYDKLNEKKHGTINIILVIDANLPPGTMTRALITCTEAKTAAIQELLVGSKYSYGLATGTGTDGCIIIGNFDSPIKLTYAGKHSKLGELIGISVKESVKEALFKESNINSSTQFSILKRLERYGITEDSLWKELLDGDGYSRITKAEFHKELSKIEKASTIVIHSSLIFHLADQFRWKLIKKRHIANTIKNFFSNISSSHKIQFNPDEYTFDGEDLIKDIVKRYRELLLNVIKGSLE